MTIIRDQGPRLAEADVASLEGRLGSKLPVTYRRFLLANNGGVPDLDVIDVPGFGPTDVQLFFGLGLEIDSICIDWNLETLTERLEPRTVVPIACDSGGNVFCLSLRPQDLGAVMYYDLAAVFADYGKAPPEYRVAMDLDEFLGRLRELKADESSRAEIVT